MLRISLLVLCSFALSSCNSGFLAQESGSDSAAFLLAKKGVALYETSCASCHSSDGKTIATTTITGASFEDIKKGQSTFRSMYNATSTLTDPDILAISEALGCRPAAATPGHATIHRLNSVEYDNTINDIFNLSIHPSTVFPPDNIGTGFFNNANSLSSVTATLVNKYLLAAEQVVSQAFIDSKESIMVCTQAGDPCARQILNTVVERIYRRPLNSGETTRLLALINSQSSFEEGVKLAIEASLVSPNFIFRAINHPSDDPKNVKTLDQYELASRLSYFLWSSTPDAELHSVAKSGGLSNSTTIGTQVTRMLASPKSDALFDNFVVQWLQLDKLDSKIPDTEVYPMYNQRLKKYMKTETQMFISNIFLNNESGKDILGSSYSFMNEDLASIYEISGVSGSEFRKVTLPAERQGLLTQSSILTITSNPSDSSIVQRGSWVLENLLCKHPPPPPDDVPAFEPPDDLTGLAKRDLASIHRTNVTCAACHSVMDPIGYSLENFDGIGTWRDTWNNLPIDASGVLPDGRTFNGAVQLADTIKSDPDYMTCVTSKLASYAIGRNLAGGDICVARSIAKDNVSKGLGMADLIRSIIDSNSFRKQSGGN